MKKSMLAAIGASLLIAALALTGCGATGENSSSAESAVPSSQIESSTPVISADVSSEASTLPSGVPADDAAFAAKFEENPLDEAYDQQMADAATTLEIYSIANTYSGLWSAEITHAYDELEKHLTDGDLSEIRANKSNWEATRESEIEKLQDSVTGDGSSAQMERAILVMEFYRDKAKELYGYLYRADPDYTYVYAPY